MPERPIPLLFDLDGTLADTIGDIAASANHVRKEHGLAPLPLETIRDCVGHGAMKLLQRALPELDLEPENARWRELYGCYAEHHENQCTATVAPYAGVLTHLEQWRQRGHPMAVVTNKPERFARRILVHLELDTYFPVVLGGDSLPQRKPHPAPVLRALSELGTEAGVGAMIGDGETDLRAGKAAGLRTIACLYGYRAEALLRSEGADEFWTQFGG